MSGTELPMLLDQLAFLAELSGENPFKVRALQNSARVLDELAEPLPGLLRRMEAGARVEGIGKGTLSLVREFLEQGRLAELEELKQKFPPGLLQLKELRGLGPKKIRALHEQLGIGGLAELEYACSENRLLGLKGFGKKSQDALLQELRLQRSYSSRRILPAALQEAAAVTQELDGLGVFSRVELSGEARRLEETVGALEFVVQGRGARPDEEELSAAGFIAGPDGSFTRQGTGGIPVVLHGCQQELFAKKLFETSGPPGFLDAFGSVPAERSEEAIFARKGRAFLPPECRERGGAPGDLIGEKDLRGVFHVHSDWSDGKNSLEELLARAGELGYEYLGVSDHSASAVYANGLDAMRVKEQKREIGRLQEKFPGIRIYHGVESDILADGSLDYPDRILSDFDFVIASVHGQLRLGRAEMTRRLCTALRHPSTTFLGHWTGRLLLGREPCDFDHDEVLRTAAGEGKALELNASPYRLDISWREIPRAIELGVEIGIHPDAHSAAGLDDSRYGVWMARKAGLAAGQVVNTRGRKAMDAWLARRKRS